MNPLDLILDVPDDAWQTSSCCPELLFADEDSSASRPTSVSPALDELKDFFSVQHAAAAGDVDSSNATTSFRDDSLADVHLTDGFNEFLTDGFNEFLADSFNGACSNKSSAIELPFQPQQAPMDHPWLSSDNTQGEADDVFDLVHWDAGNSSDSSFAEFHDSPSASSDTGHQSPTESLERYQRDDERSPSFVGDYRGWSPLAQELLSARDVERIMDEDDQLQPEETAPRQDTSKNDDDDDVVILYAWTGGGRNRQQKSRRQKSRLLGRRRSSDSSQYLAPVTGALAKSKKSPKAPKLSKRPERRRGPTPNSGDSRRWMNELFRLEKIGTYESEDQPATEYTWMGQRRGWANSKQAEGKEIADARQLSYVVVRRNPEGYPIKAWWNEERGMFMGEDGMNNKEVLLSEGEVKDLLAAPRKCIEILG